MEVFILLMTLCTSTTSCNSNFYLGSFSTERQCLSERQQQQEQSARMNIMASFRCVSIRGK